jgi:HK97 family phage major capsid protein
MGTPNRTIMEKADLEVSDLISDGGYLPVERAQTFLKDIVAESKVLSMIDVRTMKSHSAIIDKIGITGRVLRPGVSGQALPAGDRIKPTTEHVDLTTKLLKAEIRLNDEVLEDNIEQGTLINTCMQMLQEKAAYDLDDLCLNGDTASADTLLKQFDGMRKLAVTHTVDFGSLPISKSKLTDMRKAMPKQYNRFKQNFIWLTGDLAELGYRDELSDRVGNYSDQILNSMEPLKPLGVPMIPVPVMPDTLDPAASCSDTLLMDPKMAVWGFWRSIKIATDQDIVSGEWICVASLRCGFCYKEEDAVVKGYNIKVR